MSSTRAASVGECGVEPTQSNREISPCESTLEVFRREREETGREGTIRRGVVGESRRYPTCTRILKHRLGTTLEVL